MLNNSSWKKSVSRVLSSSENQTHRALNKGFYATKKKRKKKKSQTHLNCTLYCESFVVKENCVFSILSDFSYGFPARICTAYILTSIHLPACFTAGRKMKPSQSSSHSAIRKTDLFPHSVPIKMWNVGSLISTKYSNQLYCTEWTHLHTQGQYEPFLSLERSREWRLYNLSTYFSKML